MSQFFFVCMYGLIFLSRHESALPGLNAGLEGQVPCTWQRCMPDEWSGGWEDEHSVGLMMTLAA